jgi:hypothetical protein
VSATVVAAATFWQRGEVRLAGGWVRFLVGALRLCAAALGVLVLRARRSRGGGPGGRRGGSRTA